MAAIALQRDQLWSSDGFGFPPNYYFAQKSGGDRSAEVTKVRDGGSNTPEVIAQDATTSDIVLTGLYRPGDHDAVLRALAGAVGRRAGTLKRLDVDANKTPIGVVEQHAGCVLVGVKRPEFDANSTTEARFELTFTLPE